MIATPTTDRLTGSAFSMRSTIRDAALAAAKLKGVGLVDVIIGFARSNGGFCVATNEQFAEATGAAEKTITRTLARLTSAGVVYAFGVRKADGGRGRRRILVVADVVPDGLARPAILDDPAALVPIDSRGRSRRRLRVADLQPLDYRSKMSPNPPPLGDKNDPVLRARASSDHSSEKGCVAHAPPVVAPLMEPDLEPIPVEVDEMPTGTLGGPAPEIVPSGTVSEPTPKTVSSETVSTSTVETASRIDPTPNTGTAQPTTPDVAGARDPYAKAWPAKITGKKMCPKTTDQRGPTTSKPKADSATTPANDAAGVGVQMARRLALAALDAEYRRRLNRAPDRPNEKARGQALALVRDIIAADPAATVARIVDVALIVIRLTFAEGNTTARISSGDVAPWDAITRNGTRGARIAKAIDYTRRRAIESGLIEAQREDAIAEQARAENAVEPTRDEIAKRRAMIRAWAKNQGAQV